MTAFAPPSDDVQRLRAACKLQIRHPFHPRVVLCQHPVTGQLGCKLSDEPKDAEPAWITLGEIAQAISELEDKKRLSELDRFNYGCIFPTWHENLWEICKLRVRNPGVPVHFLVSGGKWSSKSEFAAFVLSKVLMQTEKREIYCISENETKSKDVQQSKLYDWLPLQYHNERGRIGTNSRQKMGYSNVSGFTNNEFGAGTGTKCRFGFWTNPITWMDGLRPYCMFSDEALPLEWCNMMDLQMPPHAANSVKFIKEWRGLLEQRKQNPALEFPAARIGDLMCGVHILTWTPSQGRTDTVDKFQSNGTTMETIEADPELLPRRDPAGTIIGGEILPRIIYGKDPRFVTRMMYAKENPIGGGGAGAKKMILDSRASVQEIRWRIYGITERSGGTPFNNFSQQVHVRPRSWIPRVGTYYMTIDPVTSGNKCWTMGIFKVAGEQQGFIAPGDIVMVHEYPQCDDMIPGVGMPDAWCSPGGKNGGGIAGNIQHAMPGGFEFKAQEIRRLWNKIGAWETEMYPDRRPGPIVIPYGNLIMDSRAANTEKENESESKTLIEWLEDLDIHCVPAGRGSGAQVGETYVAPGEQMINNLLSYDRDNCVLDENTGWMCVSPLKGRGPKLWLLENCTNMISALQNYPGIDNGGKSSMHKDFCDVMRYVVIAAPEHHGADFGRWTGGGSIANSR